MTGRNDYGEVVYGGVRREEVLVDGGAVPPPGKYGKRHRWSKVMVVNLGWINVLEE